MTSDSEAPLFKLAAVAAYLVCFFRHEEAYQYNIYRIFDGGLAYAQLSTLVLGKVSYAPRALVSQQAPRSVSATTDSSQ
jgi:hypothetical protein